MPLPVTMTVHSIPTLDLEGDKRRTRNGRFKMLMVLLLCAAPVIASYFTYFVIRPDGRTNYGSLITPTRSATDALNLRSLDGQPVPVSTLKGQWLLVAVGPSACDEACDKRLFVQRQLREMLGREKDRIDRVWLITDGQVPSSALRASADAPPPLTMLLADSAAVAAWLQPEAGHSIEEHMYIVDPMGEWMMRMPVDADPGKVKRDLSKLLRASSFWDQPGR